MRVNANANANHANRVDRSQRTNKVKAHRANKHDKANRPDKALRAKKTQRADRARSAHRADKAHQAHRADKTKKVKINASELFKTMRVTPAKGNGFVTPPKPTIGHDDEDKGIMGQAKGMGQGKGIGQANGNKPATPPGLTMKLAAKMNARTNELRTPPGQAVKELKNADNGSKLGKPDFVNQLNKKLDELMKAYEHLTKFQTTYKESGIFQLSNRLETISSLLNKSKETGSSRPLSDFVNSNLGITKAINRGGGVRIDFNPVTSAYKAAQNGYAAEKAGLNKLVV